MATATWAAPLPESSSSGVGRIGLGGNYINPSWSVEYDSADQSRWMELDPTDSNETDITKFYARVVLAGELGANMNTLSQEENLELKEMRLVSLLMKRFGLIISALLAAIIGLSGIVYNNISGSINELVIEAKESNKMQSAIKDSLYETRDMFSGEMSRLRVDIERGFSSIQKDTSSIRENIVTVSARVSGIDGRLSDIAERLNQPRPGQ